MNARTLQALAWIRECKGDDFGKGYVMGFINALTFEIEPWEKQYLTVIANQVIWKGGRA